MFALRSVQKSSCIHWHRDFGDGRRPHREEPHRAVRRTLTTISTNQEPKKYAPITRGILANRRNWIITVHGRSEPSSSYLGSHRQQLSGSSYPTSYIYNNRPSYHVAYSSKPLHKSESSVCSKRHNRYRMQQNRDCYLQLQMFSPHCPLHNYRLTPGTPLPSAYAMFRPERPASRDRPRLREYPHKPFRLHPARTPFRNISTYR